MAVNVLESALNIIQLCSCCFQVLSEATIDDPCQYLEPPAGGSLHFPLNFLTYFSALRTFCPHLMRRPLL